MLTQNSHKIHWLASVAFAALFTTNAVAQAEARKAQTVENENSSDSSMLGSLIEMVGMQALLKIVGSVLDTGSGSNDSAGSAIVSALLSGKTNNEV